MKAGDYIVRGDQPYRTLADMYFSFQSFAPQRFFAAARAQGWEITREITPLRTSMPVWVSARTS